MISLALSTLSALLEEQINYLLALDETIDIKPLMHKIVQVRLLNTPIRWIVYFSKSRVYLLSRAKAKTDLDVTLDSKTFLALISGADARELLRRNQLFATGDVKTIQLLFDLLADIELDFEELLSYYVGDTIAYQAGRAFAFIHSQYKNNSREGSIFLASAYSSFDKLANIGLNCLLGPDISAK